jgi:hypothetical protein
MKFPQPPTNHYATPKWQAQVKPHYKSFWLADGTVVSNLWQLKHTLKTAPEHILNQHIHNQTNQLADWVDQAVWDHHLARLLKNQTHRWGMIVTLERHQMRTLNLPPYLAARWLTPVPESFYLADSRYLFSLTELKHALMELDNSLFKQHLQTVPNDFINWINNSIGNYLLSEILFDIIHQTKFLTRLSDHLEMLHQAAKDY